MKLFLFLFSLVTISLFKSANAQPSGIHLSWKSSNIHSTENTMTITWFNNHLAESSVKYGIDKHLLQKVKVKSNYSNDGKTYVYSVTLNNLKPGTAYYYSCGSDSDRFSEVYSFTTAPVLGSAKKFVFGVWSDTQDNEFNTQFEKTDTIVKQLVKYPIQFTIHTGDVVNNGSMVPSWFGLFNTTEPINSKAPLMAVTGNHDVDNNQNDSGYQKPFPIFYDFLNLPENKTDYSFNYGNTHFVAISSGHAKGVEEAGNTNWRYAKESPEYAWLENDLKQARNDKHIAWIILFMHHPLYSFGWSHVQGWQDRITPLIDKYKVDLCLAGHRHVYERHKAIRNNVPLDSYDLHEYKKPAGTVYITNGTSGGSPQGLGGADMYSMLFTSAVKMYNYAIMAIEGPHISYHVYNEKGELIDYFSIAK
jgi:predicted phosphodiesterase